MSMLSEKQLRETMLRMPKILLRTERRKVARRSFRTRRATDRAPRWQWISDRRKT